MNSPDLIKVEPTYRWDLISIDPDDNKFVDCAIAANARFVVTDDKHFRVLENVEWPKVDVLSALEFMTELSNRKS